ncbi:MAG: bifunctional phosphoribosylaminoimidazolecarboxamide formyltransferase/IMP cyclohydrolase [Geminicoccaceae bacterium]|nr:bifunctional phosphoribosylaminoimidazolecarboxamide formyltransferase/IMP cyclohydrolase [Geminicoccaceae bacterium]
MHVRRALISVHDKMGLVRLAKALAGLGVEIVSTGGTARALSAASLDVTEVADLTGQAEILDGRVKTLHPAVHGALLARRDSEAHMATIEAAGIAPIDLLVVNLYPFEATAARGASFEETLEQIDIGGPAMIRSAAKNHASVLVVVDPADYGAVAAAIREGEIDPDFRRRLAAKAFARTAAYDAAIAAWFAKEADEPLPAVLPLVAARVETLRYGENPHQKAALYKSPLAGTGIADARQIQGRPLSYNNLLDADAALWAVLEHTDPAAVIVKHANPCGAATAKTPRDAYEAALACDPSSAFGGIVALNRPLDGATAAAIAKLFAEVVVAPEATQEAVAVLAAKPNLRLLVLPSRTPNAGLQMRSIGGGLLVQEADAAATIEGATVATERAPSPDERAALAFAWRVAKHVRSNAIVLAAGTATVGIGAGQMSRVDAVEIAAHKARRADARRPLVMASDAFFPFADGLERGIEAGVTAVVQPGGSLRDAEVVAAADRAGVAMLFTGRRHFRH